LVASESSFLEVYDYEQEREREREKERIISRAMMAIL